jgi:hypothetical protein
MYAATDRGNVFKRINGAWVKLAGSGYLDTVDSSAVGALAADSSGNIYASTYYGNIWKYSNGIWTHIAGNGYYGSLDNSPLWVVAVNNDIVHAGSFAGKIWSYNTELAAWGQLSGSGDEGTLDGGIAWSMVFNSNANPYVATSNGNVFKHTSGWSLLYGSGSSGTLDDSTVWSLTFDAVSGYVYAGTDNGGVFIFDGNSWTQI